MKFFYEGNIQLKPCYQQELGKCFYADKVVNKVNKILYLYPKRQLDAVESGIKDLL